MVWCVCVCVCVCVCCVHAQITQNNKLAISLQHLKKQLSNELEFLHPDKHESWVQINTMVLIGMFKHSQTSQNNKFATSLQYVKKEVRDEVDFLHADNHRSFYKMALLFLICSK